MKRVLPNLETATKNAYIGILGSSRKFKRFWGAGSINGVDVFTSKQYIYPFREDNEKLLKYLGLLKSTRESSYKGVDSTWLYLNPDKATKAEIPDLKEFIRDNLNTLFWDDIDNAAPEELKIITNIIITPIRNIVDTGDSSNFDLTRYLRPPYTSDIQSDYQSIFMDFTISHEGAATLHKGTYTEAGTRRIIQDIEILHPDDNWLYILSMCALLYSDISTIVTGVQRSYVRVDGLFNSYYKTTYVATLEIPYTPFTVDSEIVVDLANAVAATFFTPLERKYIVPEWYYNDEGTPADNTPIDPYATGNYLLVKNSITGVPYTNSIAEGDELTYTLKDYIAWADVLPLATKYSALWVVDPNSGNWFNTKSAYLRADVFDNPAAYGFKREELFSYVMSSIDFEYEKKKAKWWKNIVAIIIVVIIIYFTAGAASGYLAAAGSAVTGITAAGLAVGVIVGGLALSILTAAASALGMDDWALAFAAASQAIEPLVMVASIYLMFTGLVNMYNAASDALVAAADVAMTEATITTADVLAQMATDFIGNMAESLVAGATDMAAGTISNASLSFANTLLKLSMVPQQLKLKELQSKNKDLLAEADELEKAQELRETDVLKGWARIYSRPATADWSIYAEKFDLPYERGGGTLAMGNIQRTTKRALRKGDYTLPVFDNIIGV